MYWESSQAAQHSCIRNAQLSSLKRRKKKKESKTGDLIIPFIFDECPTLPGSKAQILYH